MDSLRLLRRCVVSLTILAGGLAWAQDLELVGPPIGNNKYRGTISAAGDADDFTGRFLQGDQLTVVLKARKVGKAAPTLRPVLSLIDPDGVARYSGIVLSKDQTAATLKNFAVDKSGLWAARIEGKDGTSGEFDVSFRVKPAAKLLLKNQELGGSLPFSRDYVFPGIHGATFDARITFTKQSTPVEVRAFLDPSGADVLDDEGDPVADTEVTKGRNVDLKGVKLGRGDGNYLLRLRIPTAESRFNLTIAVTPPKRVSSKKLSTVSPDEPTLDPAAIPFAGEPGETVRFTGSKFSTKTAPTVLFGSAPSPTVTVGGGGTTLDCVIPPRTGDALVAVYVVNPDGQGVGRDHYFAYIPPPEVSDLFNQTTGSPVRAASTAGGLDVRLVGENFEAGQVVRVGAVTVANPTFVTPTEIRFKLPAEPEGNFPVTVTDAYGRSSSTPFTVQFKTPPTFAPNPYNPGAVRVNVATDVTITGTGFSAADQLVVGGQNRASTFVNPTTRTFTMPALGAGSYSVRIIDSIGTAVDGPALEVKLPPTISAVSVSAGPVLSTNEIPRQGGATIRVDGADFGTFDTVTIGGTQVTSFLTRTSTRKEFLAPAGNVGLVSVSVTDASGQGATASNVLRYVGLVDASAGTLPAANSTDDYSAARGATGDFDGDGAFDVVIASPLGSSPGTRKEYTRILMGDGAGTLTDATASRVPKAGSDSSGSDVWDANCIAVGDLDASGLDDIVIGGSGGSGVASARFLRNDGSGYFNFDEYASPGQPYLPSVSGYLFTKPYGYKTIYGGLTSRGNATAIAIGDLDADGNSDDLVFGTDETDVRQVYFDVANSNIRFQTYWVPYIYSYSPGAYYRYYSATRVFQGNVDNGGSMYDVTSYVMPAIGDSKNPASQTAGFHARDLAIADLNQDGYQDLIIAWDDPTTVTPAGRATAVAGGTSTETPQVATRVLMSASGAFGTDSTGSWMPLPSAPEFWQARRVAAADLNGDGYPDLVLLLDKSLDEYTGAPTRNRRALRVLRNDKSKFTDVTASVLPAVVTANADDFRGDGLAVRDVNGDGITDIVISTTTALKSPTNVDVPRTRVFFGQSASSISFQLGAGFTEGVTTDTGEATDLLFVGDLFGSGRDGLLLLGEGKPGVSPAGARSRVQEWKR